MPDIDFLAAIGFFVLLTEGCSGYRKEPHTGQSDIEQKQPACTVTSSVNNDAKSHVEAVKQPQ